MDLILEDIEIGEIAWDYGLFYVFYLLGVLFRNGGDRYWNRDLLDYFFNLYLIFDLCKVIVQVGYDVIKIFDLIFESNDFLSFLDIHFFIQT